MRVRTSITVDEDLLETVDKLAGKPQNRSQFIEAAIQAYIIQHAYGERKARDLELINESADTLNLEALDVLEYQAGA